MSRVDGYGRCPEVSPGSDKSGRKGINGAAESGDQKAETGESTQQWRAEAGKLKLEGGIRRGDFQGILDLYRWFRGAVGRVGHL